ncbi:hypothetical protein ECO340P2_00041 [Escherichia phage ECO340P2]|nr:hypothetical protein ECO340P2_00041 [Escherichia phage ECO340P2]
MSGEITYMFLMIFMIVTVVGFAVSLMQAESNKVKILAGIGFALNPLVVYLCKAAELIS